MAYTNKGRLNRAMPSNKKAKLGDKLDAIITLLNELKSDFNAHTHTGPADIVTLVNECKADINSLKTAYDAHTHGGVTAGAADTAAPAASGVSVDSANAAAIVTGVPSALTTSPSVDVLN